MRAAWWWIDRWRKSTAHTDMTLAEQGAYRNLLDELWLRDGVIPNDERVLARACGDALEWPKVREKVLARFELTPEGWRHETHDEIASWSQAQAAKGRLRAANASREAGRFTSRTPAGIPAGRPAEVQPPPPAQHQPPSPSPSPVGSSRKVGSGTATDGLPASLPAIPAGQRADDATEAEIRRKQLELGSLLTELAEHPNSRQSVTAWCREVTSYEAKDGTRNRGAPDYRTITSIDRLDRSLEDAHWWIEELNGGRVVGDKALVGEALRGSR